tara:strand:- start:619 stop:885 length:267 start_codon:yes stop_codon:yes gene_type:complete
VTGSAEANVPTRYRWGRVKAFVVGKVSTAPRFAAVVSDDVDSVDIGVAYALRRFDVLHRISWLPVLLPGGMFPMGFHGFPIIGTGTHL